jgi:hypothetical protein
MGNFNAKMESDNVGRERRVMHHQFLQVSLLWQLDYVFPMGFSLCQVQHVN